MHPHLPIRQFEPEGEHELWLPGRTLWVGALCSVEEVVLRATGQRAVLKHMHAEHLGDPGLAARCLNEALLLRLLGAPDPVLGVPRLFDLGILPSGCPFLLMERLGSPLADELAAPGGRASAGTAQVGAQLATTLGSIHARGVVHRDVRPDNILFAADPPRDASLPPAVYLIDFGLAKAARTAELIPISTGDEDILGTDEYMAPEQWESAKRVTGAADVYALGVVLYRMASGRLPFCDTRRQVLMYQHLVNPPPTLPPSVPRRLARLILAMLAKPSGQRPSAAECADALRKMQ